MVSWMGDRGQALGESSTRCRCRGWEEREPREAEARGGTAVAVPGELGAGEEGEVHHLWFGCQLLYFHRLKLGGRDKEEERLTAIGPPKRAVMSLDSHRKCSNSTGASAGLVLQKFS